MAQASSPPTTEYSLLRRLIWRIVAATVVSAALLYTALFVQLLRTIDNLHDQNLTGQVQDIVRHLSVDADGKLQLRLPQALAHAYADPNGDFSYQVRDLDGNLLFASRDGGAPLDQITSKGGRRTRVFLLHGPTQPRVYAAQSQVRGPTGPLLVRVGQGTDNADVMTEETLAEFSGVLVWVFVPIFLALSGLIVFTLRSGLAPIAAASRQAAEIGPQTLHVRLPEEHMPAEIRPLVHAVNASLDRLERAFQVQRDFTADAAHELRTPLAVLRAHLDTLGDRQAAQALNEDVAAMSRIVEQLLRIAQLETIAIEPDEQADLRAVATGVVDKLGPLAVRDDKTLAVAGVEHPVPVYGNAEALGHAVRNLVENALSVVTAGGTVEITVGADGSITVDDDGPGVPVEHRAAIFQRFWRGDHSGKNRGGAGLGLAIVARIAEAHGGSIDVAESPLGGARFILRLRRATKAATPVDRGDAVPA